MMATPTQKDLENLTPQQLSEKYPATFANKQSAGTFVDRPFLDRINPFTPFNKKKFVPNEKTKQLLDKYKKEHGQNLVVLPLSAYYGDEKAKKLVMQGVQGVYDPTSFVGGLGDRRNRYVYLNPEEVTTKGKDGLIRKSPGLFTLGHEAYHAYDQSLLDDPRFGRLPSGFQKVLAGGIDALTDDKFDFDKSKRRFADAKRVYSLPIEEAYKEVGKEGMHRFKKELDANIGASKDYDTLGIEGFRTKNKNLFDYPRMYIRNHMKSFKDDLFKDAQGYDYYTDTYTDTGFNTVRGIQKRIPEMEKRYMDEASAYEDEVLVPYIMEKSKNNPPTKEMLSNYLRRKIN